MSPHVVTVTNKRTGESVYVERSKRWDRWYYRASTDAPWRPTVDAAIADRKER
jgi:hypothetical protein